MHKCPYCVYQSTRKYNLKVHVQNKHAEQLNSNAYTHAPTTVSVGPYYAAANGEVVQHGAAALHPHFDSNHVKQLYLRRG